MNVYVCQNIILTYLDKFFKSIGFDDVKMPNSSLDESDKSRFIHVIFIHSDAIPVSLGGSQLHMLTLKISIFDDLNVGNHFCMSMATDIDNYMKTFNGHGSLVRHSSNIFPIGNALSQTQTTTESGKNQVELLINFTVII